MHNKREISLKGCLVYRAITILVVAGVILAGMPKILSVIALAIDIKCLNDIADEYYNIYYDDSNSNKAQLKAFITYHITWFLQLGPAVCLSLIIWFDKQMASMWPNSESKICFSVSSIIILVLSYLVSALEVYQQEKNKSRIPN